MAISGDTSARCGAGRQALARMDVMKEVIHEEEVKMTARAGTPRCRADAAAAPRQKGLGRPACRTRASRSAARCVGRRRRRPRARQRLRRRPSFIAGGGGDEDGRTSRASGALAGARLELAEAAQELNEMHQIIESLRDSAAPSPATPASAVGRARRAAALEEVRAQLTHRIMRRRRRRRRRSREPATERRRRRERAEAGVAQARVVVGRRAGHGAPLLGAGGQGADAVAVLLKKQLEVELEHMQAAVVPALVQPVLALQGDRQDGKGHLTRADFESMMTSTASRRPPTRWRASGTTSRPPATARSPHGLLVAPPPAAPASTSSAS